MVLWSVPVVSKQNQIISIYVFNYKRFEGLPIPLFIQNLIDQQSLGVYLLQFVTINQYYIHALLLKCFVYFLKIVIFTIKQKICVLN